MDEAEIIGLLQEAGAIHHQHVVLASGKHSGLYIAHEAISSYPSLLATLADEFIARNQERWQGRIDLVACPAIGAIPLATVLALKLECRFAYARKTPMEYGSQKPVAFGPSFEKAIRDSRTILLVEDVVTTGGSIRQVADEIQSLGREVDSIAAIWVREEVAFGTIPLLALINQRVASWSPPCAQCNQGQEVSAINVHGRELGRQQES